MEADFAAMRGDMNNLSEDVSALRTTVKRVDERTLRGETRMLEMQVEQRRMSRVLDRIATSLNVGEGSAAAAAQQTADEKAAVEAEKLADAEDPITDEEDLPPT